MVHTKLQNKKSYLSGAKLIKPILKQTATLFSGIKTVT